MNIQIHVTAELNLYATVPGLISIEAYDIDTKQKVESSALTLNPSADMESITDWYGNRHRRMELPQGLSHLDYSAQVNLLDVRLPMLQMAEMTALELPHDVLMFLLPSRYCESDKLVNMAQDQFGTAKRGWGRVQTICEWINRHVHYQYGTSDSGTSAYDTAAQRRGVCRDFAHLGIAFCRALEIPARYAAGYCLGLDPPDFHAWFEAYLDGHWIPFDATVSQPRPALVTMSIGRDAADCAWSTFFGAGNVDAMSVEVSEVNSPLAPQTT